MARSSPPTDPELIRFLRDELGESLGLGGTWQHTNPLWLWRGKSKDGTPTSTACIDMPVADAIRAASPGRSAAWGSVSVTATIGRTTSQTSVFS